MGSFLLKNGVLWRGFEGSAIFALGFYTYEALSPYSKTRIKEVKKFLAETKSDAEVLRAGLAKCKEIEKMMDREIQRVQFDIAMLYMTRLEELRKADGRYSVGTGCDSQEESALVQRMKTEMHSIMTK